MLFPASDIHFANDDIHRFMPWLIGIMALLATFFLCIDLTVDSWANGKNSRYDGTITINIPSDREDTDGARVKKIHDMLTKVANIATVTQMSQQEEKAMIAPWFGAAKDIDELPLPTILEITLDNAEKPFDTASLQKALSAIAPATELDAHEHWAATFSRFYAAVRVMAFIFAALTLAAMATIIIFSSRASLKLHAKSVHLLHAIGATDGYIIHQFQRESARLVFQGTLVGCLTAGFIYWGMSLYIASLKLVLMPSLNFSLNHAVLVICMPTFCAFMGWLSTRMVISAKLKRAL